MKRIFLLFGVAAFTSATAQQKDIFNIERHLQKKNPTIIAVLSATLSKLPKSTYISPKGNCSISCRKPDMDVFHIMANRSFWEKTYSVFFLNHIDPINPVQMPYGKYN